MGYGGRSAAAARCCNRTEWAGWWQTVEQNQSLLLEVDEVEPGGFEAFVARDAVLVFANPNCPRCRKFAPELADLKSDPGVSVAVGAIDCSKHGFFCHNTHGVGGYPEIQLFTAASRETVTSARDKQTYKKGRKYTGKKEAGAIRAFLKSELIGIKGEL